MKNNLKVAAILLVLAVTLSSCYYGHYGSRYGGRPGYGYRGGGFGHKRDHHHGNYNHGGVRHYDRGPRRGTRY